MSSNRTLPVYYLSHGGGPWPYMKEQLGGAYDRLEQSLADLPRQVGGKPKAVLMISGHWEDDPFAVMANPKPPMIYDYSGFPEHTYHVKYNAPGAPDVAARVQGLLRGSGIPCRLDPERGYDHGTFSPMAVIYPNADVPVLQLSLHSGYDPKIHLAAGRALTPLRDEDILIIGSGLSYHNLRKFGPAAKIESQGFDQWLQATLLASTPEQRLERLIGWEQAPFARQAHPQEDHLIPLMVAVGAAERATATCIYHEEAFMGGVAVSSFRFD